MGKKSTTNVPAPDPAVGQAALKQAQLGEDWLKAAKDQFAIDNKRQENIDALATEVTRDQLNASRTAQTWAAEDRARSRVVFEPLQNRFIEEAHLWDSDERQQKVASEAEADVQRNAALARDTRSRQMSAMGIDPTSGRYAGVERAADMETALATAGAGNNARNTVRKEAMALRADAVNMGNGLGVNPGTSLGLGVQAGGAAMGTALGAAGNARANTGVLQSGYNGAMQGNSSQASILQGQYNGQVSAWSAQQQARTASTNSLFSGLGTLGGMALGAATVFSSKDAKEDKRPVRGALEAVEAMPVEEWTYKRGVADEGRHIGPYAEDFHAATGKGDGKSIPIIDALGVTMGAVQELAQEVRSMRGSGNRRAKPRSVIERQAA